MKTEKPHIAIIVTKSFDTTWASRLIRDYLASSGFVVSMQNSINEPRIAAIVGYLGRDILAGRRSEIDFVNGMIADKGDELGVPVPIHRGLTTIVKRIERGELTPGKSNILNLITSGSDKRSKTPHV